MPKEILERPVSLRKGIGNLHEEVTTSSPQAQAFYDQGLNYLHAYDWIESARGFNQALRLDPKLALAYLGLSDVYTELQDDAAARAAFEKAEALSAGVSERERTRIQIRAAQIAFLEDPNADMQKYFAWRKSIGDALAATPNDPWLWILRGFADEGKATANGQGGGVDTIAFYETALKYSPDNSAAHHYLAHTFENLGRTEQALEQTGMFVALAPTIPHAHHMRGHELRRLGRTAEAIEEFRKADELENNYYRTENISSVYDWHHAHNLSLLAMCYESLGQMKAAEPLLREAFSLPAYTDISEFNRREWPDFLLDRGRPGRGAESLARNDRQKFACHGPSCGPCPGGQSIAGHESRGRCEKRVGIGRARNGTRSFRLDRCVAECRDFARGTFIARPEISASRCRAKTNRSQHSSHVRAGLME